MPVTNVPTPGSPIRSNWAQSVSNLANANETALPTKVAKAGDAMTGALLIGANPTGGAGAQFFPEGRGQSSVCAPTAAATANLALARGGSPASDAAAIFVRFMRSANPANPQEFTIGSITVATGGAAVVYNTSSDYRLKDVLGDVDDPVGRIAALTPRHLRWKGTDAEFDGFLAHEVAEVVPWAVTGEKDAVLPPDDEANPGGIDPQQLDISQLVPILVAALQSLAARVAQLEATR